MSIPESVISRQINIVEVLLAYGADATLRRNVQSRGASGGTSSSTEDVTTAIVKNQQRFKKDLLKLGKQRRAAAPHTLLTFLFLFFPYML